MASAPDPRSLDFVAFLSEAASVAPVSAPRVTRQQVLGAVSYEQRRERAAGYLAPMDVAALKSEPNAFKLTLLTYLNHEPRPEDRAALSKLYQAFTLDDGFVAHENKQLDSLVNKMKSEQFLMDARADWPKMSAEARAAVMEKVAAMHSKHMGFEPTKVSLFHQEPDEKKRLKNGCLDRVSGTIKLNSHPIAKLANFADAINLVIHENSHNHQIQLARRFTQGSVPSSDLRHTQARIFRENLKDGSYIAGQLDFIAYKAQPLEAHANAAGAYVARHFMQPDLSPAMRARAGAKPSEKVIGMNASAADIKRAQAAGQDIVFRLD